MSNLLKYAFLTYLQLSRQERGRILCWAMFAQNNILPGAKWYPAPIEKYCLTSSIYFLNTIYFVILKLKVVAENLENGNKKKTLISLLSTDNTSINTLVSSLSALLCV